VFEGKGEGRRKGYGLGGGEVYVMGLAWPLQLGVGNS